MLLSISRRPPPRTVIGADAFDGLQRLHAVVALDFYGIDFCQRDDGAILIFELNPAVRHSFEHAEAFAYLRPHLETVTEAFEAMVLRRVAKPSATGNTKGPR